MVIFAKIMQNNLIIDHVNIKYQVDIFVTLPTRHNTVTKSSKIKKSRPRAYIIIIIKKKEGKNL